ncbi:glycoside hydrolase family 6 protein [Streptomyces sp. NPDC059698]|uniref:glycoside hydrolase family 6 protein n=1 Tax=unclassified Streptomyces TaxID=2593676 RepID=UPI00093A064E|nr:glycoside hydrolase family 6 protein [Streptomyces sp. CB02366]OKJ40389.1 endoglucanase [Streptomyces sp. CB02366]WSS57801.1 glycoside hydrolase family 6 protein [Streptomyces sp. NBC_01178]
MSGRSTVSRALPRTGPVVLAALVLVTALTAGCSTPEPRVAPTAEEAGGNLRGEPAPSAASPYWVDPDSDAARQVRAWEKEGREGDAKILRRISDRPVADWPAWDDPAPGIRAAVRAAARTKKTVLLVAYNIPHRDCGLYSAGGAKDADAYRSWIGAFADAIGDAPATVVLEPDALPHIADGCTPPGHHAERYQLLSEAVDTLKARPNTRVYLDAGNPDWIDEPSTMAQPLRRAGIDRADGFSLNVSNFQSNENVKAYAARLSDAVGGSHFVIDTSRNGKGPLSGGREEAWCNPPGRGLGTPPTTDTGDDRLDAYLWIKRPGDSDGTCRGGPPAGDWWPEYALGLAERAAS